MGIKAYGIIKVLLKYHFKALRTKDLGIIKVLLRNDGQTHPSTTLPISWGRKYSKKHKL